MKIRVMAMMVLSATLMAAAEPPVGNGGKEGPGARPPSVVDEAKRLPPLERKGGVVAVPLTNASPWQWQPVRDGIEVTSAKEENTSTLTVSYTRTKGAAAGAAIVLPPGSLQGLSTLRLAVASDPSQRLLVSLKDEAGLVWSFPTVKAGADRVTVDLKAADVALDSFQNPTRPATPPAFDPSKVVMLMVLDINGFMGAPEKPCAVTISTIEAVCR